MESRSERRAYFFVGKPETNIERYSHSAVVVAEGLTSLGWNISSDVQAWQTAPGGSFLFPGDGPKAIQHADLIVFGDNYFVLQDSDRLPSLPLNSRAPKVYLDRTDLTPATNWLNRSSFRKLDLIVRCHSLEKFRYPNNVMPSVFGISDRIATACSGPQPANRSGVVWNFNHGKHPHSVRLRAESKVRPLLASRFEIATTSNEPAEPDSDYGTLMRKQTDGRHFGSYYKGLKRALMCSCFGGYFLLPVRQREAGPFCMWTRRVVKRLPIATSLVAQWDSWRLWEAFAAGAAVLHVDFEKNHFVTGGPMPKPWEHYIPVDLSNPQNSLLRIFDEPDEIARIGENGRRWALENYNSRVITKRILDRLGLTGTREEASLLTHHTVS